MQDQVPYANAYRHRGRGSKYSLLSQRRQRVESCDLATHHREEHNINKAISELRRALTEKRGEHRFVATQPGRGYRFVADAAIAVPRETDLRKSDERPMATSETSSSLPATETNAWRSRNLRYLVKSRT